MQKLVFYFLNTFRIRWQKLSEISVIFTVAIKVILQSIAKMGNLFDGTAEKDSPYMSILLRPYT
jgi:hypothetical protein